MVNINGLNGAKRKVGVIEALTNFALKFVAISVIVLDYVNGLGICVQISCLFLCGVYFLKALLEKNKINFINVLSLMFLCYCYTVKDYRYDFWRSIGFSKETANSVMIVTIVSFALIKCLDTKEKRDIFIKYIINSGMILAVYLVFILKSNLFLGLHGKGIHDILQNYGMNSNSLGATLSLGFLLSVYIASIDKGGWYKFCMIVLFAFSIISGSRKVIIYIIVGISIYYLLKNGSLSFKAVTIKRIIKTIFVSVLLILLLYYVVMKISFVYELIGRRIEEIFAFFTGDTKDGSLIVRNDMIEKGWEYFEMNPWFGNGLNSFGYFYKDILGRETYAHNNYIELLVSVGIIGTVIYYFRYFVVIKRLVFGSRGEQDAILTACAIAIICSDIGSVTYYYKFYYIIFGIAAAAAVGLINEKKQRREKRCKR